ncbi:MAG: hypothetical protein ABEJ43_10225 [Haloferacaceae archaeon]
MANDLEQVQSAGPRPQETTWFDTTDRLLDAIIDANETVECTFEEFAVDVPVRIGDDAPRAQWHLDGTVRVSVEGTRGPLSEWLRWWAARGEEE